MTVTWAKSDYKVSLLFQKTTFLFDLFVDKKLLLIGDRTKTACYQSFFQNQAESSQQTLEGL